LRKSRFETCLNNWLDGNLVNLAGFAGLHFTDSLQKFSTEIAIFFPCLQIIGHFQLPPLPAGEYTQGYFP